MTKVLNSQSDSIVVVSLQPEKAPETGVTALYGTLNSKMDDEAKEPPKIQANVQFCNSKSIELFGVDLTSINSEKNDLYKAET